VRGAPPTADGVDLVREIERAAVIRRQVEDNVDADQIPLLHICNVMSLSYNLPAALAFTISCRAATVHVETESEFRGSCSALGVFDAGG
jgi:hypothetical protein